MARKDITDEMVVRACNYYDAKPDGPNTASPAKHLAIITGEPAKVVHAAIERAEERGYVEIGTSVNLPWATPEGQKMLGEPEFPPADSWQ